LVYLSHDAIETTSFVTSQSSEMNGKCMWRVTRCRRWTRFSHHSHAWFAQSAFRTATNTRKFLFQSNLSTKYRRVAWLVRFLISTTRPVAVMCSTVIHREAAAGTKYVTDFLFLTPLVVIWLFRQLLWLMLQQNENQFLFKSNLLYFFQGHNWCS
jgi:hypothetical protein